ncbi:phytase [Niveomyces insectorum RCEF 264]|uniref:3-phytase n=1 Tax=Niveomyces insectorum RCEF 264 TaxID=1081102 RepID=A0A167QY52_9HYPO|nr:phytase [Niveomyces insectorum RCEF 264]
MDPASLLHGVRAFFDRQRHRYQSLPTKPSIENGYEDVDRSQTDRQQQNRVVEPLLYAEPVGRGRTRRPGAEAEGYYDGADPHAGPHGNRSKMKLTLVLVSLGLLLYLGVAFSRSAHARGRKSHAPACDTPAHGYRCHPTVAPFWGQYAPFFSVPSDVDATSSSPSSSTTAALPPNCRYTFAQVLSRHGARSPTAGKSKAYAATIARIFDSATVPFADGPDGAFAFLNDYRYRLGSDELTRFGEKQMFYSGTHFYERYQSLIRRPASGGNNASSSSAPCSSIRPFVRAADQHRVVISALYWLDGFDRGRLEGPFDDDDDVLSTAASSMARARAEDVAEPGSYEIVLLPERAGFNNTLSYNGLCPAFTGSAGHAAQRTFAATFVPAITARLNRGLPDANLTDAETVQLMDLCPFETVADKLDVDREDNKMGGRELSPFCGLFTEAEWRAYDYLQTLGKWYGNGAGSVLGATQGVGFVNELIARLTVTPVADRTSTNRTLDANPATFPLNATVYADFSHDNDMTGVFAALGLYGPPEGRPGEDGGGHPSNTTRTEPGALRGYAASWTVPFAARMYVEKMVCDEDDNDDNDGNEELVRILVNDRVIPLEHCGADALGRCTLRRFVDSLAFARRGGNWDDCFA